MRATSGAAKHAKGMRWDFNGDGIYPRDRVKGAAKLYWTRWMKRKGKDRAMKDWQDEQVSGER